MISIEYLERLLSEYPVDANVSCVTKPKDDGTSRTIIKPNTALNQWLKRINYVFCKHYKNWPGFMHGGIKGRSYVSFARPHANKRMVITIDIRNCFGSITQKEIQQTLANKLGLPSNLALRLAAKLCYKRRIPQGFATSNYLTNLYLNDTLLRINQLLKHERADMTIYVDDIALSGQKINPEKVINLVAIELSRSKLAVSKAKIKVMPSNMPQIICGLSVNKGVSITRQKRRELFSDLANGRMTETTLKGWLANLNTIDKQLMKKLHTYAVQKNDIKLKSKL